MKKRKLTALIFSIIMAAGLIYQPKAEIVLAEEAAAAEQPSVIEEAAATEQPAASGQGAGTEQPSVIEQAAAEQPSSQEQAAEAEQAPLFSVGKADSSTITVSSGAVDRIYTDVYIGKRKPVTEMYKLKGENGGEKSVNIDISYLKGKAAEVKIYSRKDPAKVVTVKLNAQPKKLKGKFNAKTGTFTVTLAGSAVKNEDVICRIGRRSKPLSEYNFENYYVKGATVYISTKESGQTDETIDIGKSVTITPASKEAKAKVPARAKGPTVKIAPGTMAMYVYKGWVYQTAGRDNTVVSETATAAKWVDIAEFVSRAGIDIDTPDEDERNIVSDAAVIEVYKAATDTKLESKTTDVTIPWQPLFDEKLISSTSGISYVPLYNAAKTKQTGIKLTNKSSQTMQASVLPYGMEVSDIKLLETDANKKLTWTEVKPNRTVNITSARVVSGAQVVYRIGGAAATSTTKLKFASTIMADPERITVAEAAVNDSGMIEISGTPTTGAVMTASGTTLTIKQHTNAVKYVYAVRDRGIAGVELGYTLQDVISKYDLTNDVYGAGVEMPVKLDKKNLWIIVFAVDEKDKVIAYSNRQVTESYMY